MRQPLVAGNWKMNGTRAEAEALLKAVAAGAASVKKPRVVVCPPAILVPLAAERLAGGNVAWGGQNLSEHAAGAYTGEIAGAMLRDYGCTYVIIGHSERRSLYGDTDDGVARKFIQAQACGLTPILCVGESLQEREGNRTEAVVARQLDAVLSAAGIERLRNAIIAYEPVWAIGTGKVATPAQAQAVHRFIRERLAKHNNEVAQATVILYGGSVKGSNAKELFAQDDIDGGLIGGASLNADEFLAICRAAE